MYYNIRRKQHIFVRANGDLSSEKERIVVDDAFDQKASCSCQQFARTSVVCAHDL
jgi:hypothetical protein